MKYRIIQRLFSYGLFYFIQRQNPREVSLLLTNNNTPPWRDTGYQYETLEEAQGRFDELIREAEPPIWEKIIDESR